MVAKARIVWLLICWGLVAQAAGSNTEGAKAVSQLQPVRVQRSALFAVLRNACVVVTIDMIILHTLMPIYHFFDILIAKKQIPGLLQQFEAVAATIDILPGTQYVH
jgi:hypothetical protein